MEWIAYTMAAAFVLIWAALLYRFIKATRAHKGDKKQ